MHQIYSLRLSRNHLAGILLLLLSTAAWSLSLITAFLLSREGMSVNTANAARYTVGLFAVFMFVCLRGHALRLPRRGTHLGLLLGICGYIISFGYLHSTQHIPVSFAVLLFYTAPFLVALVAGVVNRAMLSIIHIGAMTAGFVGLALILEVGNAAVLSTVGVGLALFAALGLAGQIIIANFATRYFAAPVLSLYALATATILLWLTLFFTDDLTLPSTVSALVKLLIIGTCLAIAQVAMFIGVRKIGSIPAAVLMNMEPVFTIALAIIIIGEQLNGAQLVGTTLVIGAVVAVTLRPGLTGR